MSVRAAHLTPKTLRYCRACAKETPHEIRESPGVIAAVCVRCAERALSYELDRE
jgi:hypothetical protein